GAVPAPGGAGTVGGPAAGSGVKSVVCWDTVAGFSAPPARFGEAASRRSAVISRPLPVSRLRPPAARGRCSWPYGLGALVFYGAQARSTPSGGVVPSAGPALLRQGREAGAELLGTFRAHVEVFGGPPQRLRDGLASGDQLGVARRVPEPVVAADLV